MRSAACAPFAPTTLTSALSAMRSGGKSICGSPCARLPPMVATLRTRMLESRRIARGMTGTMRATSGERSTRASGVMAPMVSAPSGAAAMRVLSRESLRKLTSRLGRNTPAFIISISAVPPAIGRTPASSGSSSAMASPSEAGSTSSNGVMWRSRIEVGTRRRPRACARRSAAPCLWPWRATPAGRGCRVCR